MPHETTEKISRITRTTRATQPVWLRMFPRSVTKNVANERMIYPSVKVVGCLARVPPACADEMRSVEFPARRRCLFTNFSDFRNLTHARSRRNETRATNYV